MTGGAGFIGSHLVDELIKSGISVKVIDNLSSGNKNFLHHHMDNKMVEFINGDITSFSEINLAIKNVDVVFHLAANPDIRLGTEVTDTDLNQGTIATYNVLEAMRLNNVKKIVFASSSVVYGEDAPMPTPESFGPCMPISLYGASKLASEGLITSFSGTFGIQCWIFRFANIIGERGTHGVIFDFIHKLKLDNSKLEVLGNGLQEKSYMEVKDCVKAIMHIFSNEQHSINLFNLGSHDTCSVKRIAEIVIEQTGLKNVVINYTGGSRGWAGDIPKSMLSINKMLSTGYDVEYDSEAAVRYTAKSLIEEIGL